MYANTSRTMGVRAAALRAEERILPSAAELRRVEQRARRATWVAAALLLVTIAMAVLTIG